MNDVARDHPNRGPGVLLSELVERLERAELLIEPPEVDVRLTGVSADSRHIGRGELYCAWRGTTVDGHSFVGQAEDAGAAAAIVERIVRGIHMPQVLVRDGRRATAIAAGAVYGDPQKLLRLVAVTGTNGKTTTVWILRHLLSAEGRAGSLGTLGVILDDGSTLPASENLTTPGPVELARTLRGLVDRGIRAVAMETSSHALHQGRLAALRFDVAVFTNLSRDHLDYHGTLEQYLEAKLRLCGLLKPAGYAVVNAEDPAWTAVRERAPKVLTFALGGDASVSARDVSLTGTGSRFECVYRGWSEQVELPLLGAFNVQNALAATAAMLVMGASLGEVAASLATVPQVPGRLERIADVPCPVLRDYAHTPDALERALDALRPLTAGRLIVVFGAGGDRDAGKRPIMGSIAERGADEVIVTSDNPRTENPNAIIDAIVGGMTPGSYTRVTDRREAITHALETARPDDLILLAGKGHEDYQLVGTRKLPFDERVVVNELLARRAQETTP